MPRLNKRRRQALKRKKQANKEVLSHNLATELGEDVQRETRLRTATSQLNKAASMHAVSGSDWRTTRHEPAPAEWQKNYKLFSNK